MHIIASFERTEKSRVDQVDQRALGPLVGMQRFEEVNFSLFVEQHISLPMNGALHVPTSKEREGIAGIYSESSVLRFDVFPFSGNVVLHLQSSNRLSEKQSPRPKICECPYTWVCNGISRRHNIPV